MKETENTEMEVKEKRKEPSPGRLMPAGIGIGATVGILFGNFILGPASGSQTGLVLGMSMGAGTGLVIGLSLGSGGKSKPVSKKKK